MLKIRVRKQNQSKASKHKKYEYYWRKFEKRYYTTMRYAIYTVKNRKLNKI